MHSSRISLITICFGRETHLYNLLLGVAKGEVLPEEVVVVADHRPAFLDDFTNLTIRYFPLPAKDANGGYSLGEARNRGAAAARYPHLVFLDVDCVPAPNFLANMRKFLPEEPALLMGDPRYLPQPLPREWEMAGLEKLAVVHPHRTRVPATGITSSDYGSFWSLCFSLTASTYEHLGGFDLRYEGYGAEDTDLAFTARKLGIELLMVPSVVYHQQHAVYRPPVNNFLSIVKNARVFYGKWDHWPMAGWLAAFAELDLIEWNGPESDQLTVISHPDPEMLAKSKHAKAAFA